MLRIITPEARWKALVMRSGAGETRGRAILFPGRIDDCSADDNPARVIDAFIDELG
jgi:hypothetical protein